MPPMIAAAAITAAGTMAASKIGANAQKNSLNSSLAAQNQFQNAAAARLSGSAPNFASFGQLVSQASPLDVPGGGINVNTGRFENPNQGTLQGYSNFLSTPQYQKALSNVTGLANLIQGGGAGLYNTGAPAYQQALNYYQQILGGDKAAGMRAIAPQVSQQQDVAAGAQRALDASGLRGGARDLAQAQLAQQTAGNISNLIPQAQQTAASQAGQLGLAGTQQGMAGLGTAAGLGQSVAGMEQARQQAAAGLEQSNRQLGANAYLQGQGLNLQQLLGLTGLGVNERLGLGQLGIEQGNQALQGWLGSNQIIAGAGNPGLYAQQMANQQGAAAGSAYGGLFGQLGNAAVNAYGNWYNNRGGIGGGVPSGVLPSMTPPQTPTNFLQTKYGG